MTDNLVVVSHLSGPGRRSRNILHPMDLLPPTPSWHQVVNGVAIRHAVPASLLLTHTRYNRVAAARLECYWRLRNEFRLLDGTQPSWNTIARWMKRDHHSTVLQGAQRYAAGMAS